MFQFGQLVPELPAVENIALPLLLAGRRRAARRWPRRRAWLPRLGLDGLGERLPGELSGGQGQRVALARALVANPKIVFADEPTGSLDSVAADQVMELLVDAAREQGTSVLVVTHEARVAAYADRTVMVRDGVDALQVGARMSRSLGLRLAVAGGREALLRLAFTAVGGRGRHRRLLLLALTAPVGGAGPARTGSAGRTPPTRRSARRPSDDPPVESADGALFLAVSDYYDGIPMTRAYVAALGADPPVPPGLDRLPGPGEVAASPAMRRLLESTPDDQLDDRFPGRVTMTIGAAGLAHDNELVAIIGRTPDQLRDVRSVQEVRGFDTCARAAWRSSSFLRILLLIGAVLVLVPVVILIVMVTRVAAAQREQRLAAIRLVGATRRRPRSWPRPRPDRRGGGLRPGLGDLRGGPAGAGGDGGLPGWTLLARGPGRAALGRSSWSWSARRRW